MVHVGDTTMKMLVVSDKLYSSLRKIDQYFGPNRISNDNELYKLAAEERQKMNAPIREVLDRVNGKATSFTVNHPINISNLALDVEATLEKSGISVKNRKGTTVVYVPAGPAASAYKYSAVSTKITLLRGSGYKWYVTDISRTEVHPKQSKKLSITITTEAANDVVRNALHNVYKVKE